MSALSKLQREHPHKLSDYIVKERRKRGLTPLSSTAHRVSTAVFLKNRFKSVFQSGPKIGRTKPHLQISRCLYVFLFGVWLRGHRPLSEQGIITRVSGRSTIKCNYFHCSNRGPKFTGLRSSKRKLSDCFICSLRDCHARKLPFPNLVHMTGAGSNFETAIFNALAIDSHGPLLYHAKSLRGAANEARFL